MPCPNSHLFRRQSGSETGCWAREARQPRSAHIRERETETGAALCFLPGTGQFRRSDAFRNGGVEPNPRHTTVDRAGGICRDKNIDVLPAVGGGSVTDCAKLTSPAVFHNGTCRDFPAGRAQMKKFLPIVTISTIFGTGTDMDCLGIVNNIGTQEKTFSGKPALYPSASFPDPTGTFTVSPYQTESGAIDAFVHYLGLLHAPEPLCSRQDHERLHGNHPPFHSSPWS